MVPFCREPVFHVQFFLPVTKQPPRPLQSFCTLITGLKLCCGCHSEKSVVLQCHHHHCFTELVGARSSLPLRGGTGQGPVATGLRVLSPILAPGRSSEI